MKPFIATSPTDELDQIEINIDDVSAEPQLLTVLISNSSECDVFFGSHLYSEMTMKDARRLRDWLNCVLERKAKR